MNQAFVGTRHLVQLILRRDRIRLPLWIVGLGGVIALSALAVPPLYDTPQKVAGYAKAVGTSPISYLMSGRQVGIDTLGGIVANEISQVAQLGICLMVLFLVVRHTRAEEESGRAELLRSTVLGRHAATLAGLLYGVAATLLIGLLTTGSMLAADLEVRGSLTYGAGLTLLGLCYVGVTLVAVQLSTSARGALGLAGAAIAVGYLVRGVGAMQDNALTWASPFGWAQAMNAFGDERVWPAALLVLATAALLFAAAWLTAHRDFAGGILRTKAGPGRASRLLSSPAGLVFRLQRGLVIGWAIGLTALGVLYGAVIPTIPDLVESNPDILQVIGAQADAEQALINAFLRYIFVFMAVISTGFAVASVLRVRSEEESGCTEVVLATPVRRSTWLGSGLLVSGLGILAHALLMGTGLAVGYGLGMKEWDQFGPQVGAQLSYAPGVLVVAAGAAAIVAIAPRWTGAAWALVAFIFIQVMLGETLGFPEWVDQLSPFTHLAAQPVENFDLLPAAAETALAALLTLLALWGYRRRDLVTG